MNLLEYILERQRIHEARVAGLPAPWTTDRTLQTTKFCCVIRDDDRTSREAREIVQGLPRETALAAALSFRLYNRVSTLQALVAAGAYDHRGPTASGKVLEVLESLPMVFNTTAYRVTVRGGLWNLPTIARMIALGARAAREEWQPRRTAELTCQALSGMLEAGPFLCYQIMQDLRWLGHRYEDERSWCVVGPGAVRALQRMEGEYDRARQDELKARPMNRGRTEGAKSASDVETARWLPKMRALLPGLPDYVNMFELEHNLCEWDKYMRVSSGEAKGLSYKP